MKVAELKSFLKKMPDSAEIDVLIENTAQWQFSLNECAYSSRQNLVILMHEKEASDAGSQLVEKKSDPESIPDEV